MHSAVRYASLGTRLINVSTIQQSGAARSCCSAVAFANRMLVVHRVLTNSHPGSRHYYACFLSFSRITIDIIACAHWLLAASAGISYTPHSSSPGPWYLFLFSQSVQCHLRFPIPCLQPMRFFATGLISSPFSTTSCKHVRRVCHRFAHPSRLAGMMCRCDGQAILRPLTRRRAW